MSDQRQPRRISRAEADALLANSSAATSAPSPRVVSRAEADALLGRQSQAPQQPQNLNAKYGKRDDFLGNVGTFGRRGVDAIADATRSVFGQGLLMQGGDELEAYARSALLGQDYDAALGDVRQRLDKLQAQQPVSNTIGQMAGGAVVPGLAFKNAANISRGGRILRGVGTGAATAGADGFLGGRDGVSNRITNAALSAAIGGVGAGAFSGLVEALGSAGKIGGTALKNVDPGVKVIARRLADAPRGVIDEGVEAARRAQKSGVPQFMPELLNDADGYDFARYLRNESGSNRIAEQAIDARDAGLIKSLKKGLTDRISSQTDSRIAGRRIKNLAEEYMTAAGERRASAVEKLYSKAYKKAPQIDDDYLKTLVKDGDEKTLAKQIRKQYDLANNSEMSDFVAALESVADEDAGTNLFKTTMEGLKRKYPEYKDLDPTNIKMVHRTVQHLEGLAAKTDVPAEKADILTLVKPVRDALKKSSPEFAKADRRYRRFSEAIKYIDEGIIGEVSRAKTSKDAKIGGKLIAQRAKDIQSLKRSFKGKEDELKSLLRAHYEDVLDAIPRELESAGKQNPLRKLVGTENQEGVIRELLGDKDADELLRFFSDQDRMLAGRQKYHKGSTTQGNQAEEKRASAAIRGALNWARNMRGSALDVLEEALGGDPTGKREAAGRIMFNPDASANVRALEELQRVQPIIHGNPEMKALVQALGTQGARTAADKREEIPHLYITPPKQ